MKTKTCKHCLGTFEESQDFFNKDNRNGGYRSKCKSCEKKYRDENKERIKQVNAIYRKQNDLEIKEKKKAYSQKNKDKENARWYSWLEKNVDKFKAYQKEYSKRRKESKKEYDKEYRENNRQKIIERQKRWCKENIEHVRRKSIEHANKYRSNFLNAEGSFTANDIIEIYQKQNGECAYCGKFVGDTYDVDHIIPLSRGGSNFPSNLAIACPKCNRTKSNKLLIELGWKLIR